MKKYSEYFQNGEFEKFVDGLAFDEKQDVAKMKEQKEALVSLLKKKVYKEQEKKGGIKNFEIISEEIAEDGNTTVVKQFALSGIMSAESHGWASPCNTYRNTLMPS